MPRVACNIEVVVQHNLLQDSECTSEKVTRWSMHGRMPTQMHPHETSRKTNAKPWVARSQVSRFVTMGIRVLSVCTRTKIDKSNVSIMGQIQESARGWRTIASKSTSTNALLPAMSSIALETRAVHNRQLDLSGLRLLRMCSRRVSGHLETCGARERRSPRTAMQCAKAGIQRLSVMRKIKNTIKVEKRRTREVLEKRAHKTLFKKPAITTPHTFGQSPSKNAPTIRKNPKELQNALPENCSKIFDKRKFAQSRCTLTQLLAEQRETVHTLLFFFHFPPIF